jgi:hypothetical protein
MDHTGEDRVTKHRIIIPAARLCRNSTRARSVREAIYLAFAVPDARLLLRREPSRTWTSETSAKRDTNGWQVRRSERIARLISTGGHPSRTSVRFFDRARRQRVGLIGGECECTPEQSRLAPRRVNILRSGLHSAVIGGAYVHVYPRSFRGAARNTDSRAGGGGPACVREARSCPVHVEGARSIVLASQGCCVAQPGWWVGIEFIAYAVGILIEPTTTRRHV